MPLLRSPGTARTLGLGLGALLVTLALAALGAVLPVRTATAADAPAVGSLRVEFADAGIWGGDLRSTYALTTKPVPVQFPVRRSWTGTGGATAAVTAVVERRPAGGTWKATAQRVLSRSASFGLLLPAYSTSATAKDATVDYRLHVHRSGVVGNDTVSATITLRYRNPARFTGLTAALYRAVHPYCQSAVVRVVRLQDAAGDYTTGQYALNIDTSTSAYAAVDRRAVALHECGHYLQWRNYGASAAGWSRMTADAKAVFGTNSRVPVEHMADCVAQAANPGGYLGYGGACTKPQLAAAERVLAGYRVR